MGEGKKELHQNTLSFYINDNLIDYGVAKPPTVLFV